MVRISEDRDRARDQVLRHGAGYVATLVSLYHDTFPHGEALKHKWPFTGSQMTEETLDYLIDNGFLLCGTPEEVCEQFAKRSPDITPKAHRGSERGPDDIEGSAPVTEQAPGGRFPRGRCLGELFYPAPQHPRSLADNRLEVGFRPFGAPRVLFPYALRRGVGGFLCVGGRVSKSLAGGCANISLVLFARVLAKHLTGKAAGVLRLGVARV